MPKQNFKLDNHFYTQNLLESAIRDFSDFTIKISSTGIEIEDEDPEKIFDEFSNYCIALSNENIA